MTAVHLRSRFVTQLGAVVVMALASSSTVPAGNLDPPSGPDTAGSQMYTLEDLYNRIDDGAAATKMTSFAEPSAGPGSTGRTLDEIYTLASERARVPRTGQIASEAPGDDGALQKGVTWPSPRFADNGDGTVTDILTGLIWLQDANCDGTKSWSSALSWANGLFDGCASCGGTNSDCNLSDGSSAGDWRLANVRELHSLVDFSMILPALPFGHPFEVQTDYYWSSTTVAGGSPEAWHVSMAFGTTSANHKLDTLRVWPVRGGQ